MRIGRLFRYTVVAAISGTIGFLIGGGQLPESLYRTPGEIATRARETARDFQQGDTTLTSALNHLHDRLSDSAQQLSELLDDEASR